MKKLALLLLLIPPFITGMEQVPSESVICRSSDPVKVLYDKTHYYVSDDNASYRIPKHEISPILKEVLKRHAVSKYAREAKIRVLKHSEGYGLSDKVPGNGGGWLTGQIAAWTVRGVGYGGYAVACVFHPELLLEAEVAHAAIESVAIGAQVAGECLPTP